MLKSVSFYLHTANCIEVSIIFFRALCIELVWIEKPVVILIGMDGSPFQRAGISGWIYINLTVSQKHVHQN